MHRIADDQRQRIGEDGRGLLERHAVLAMVRSGLARVPAESYTRKCMTLNDGDDKSRPSRIHGFAASSGGQAIDSVSPRLAPPPRVRHARHPLRGARWDALPLEP